MQGKTEKMKKTHPLDTTALKKKRNSREFALKPRESHSRRDRKGYSHNCISQIMLKSKESANNSHDEAPVGNHKKQGYGLPIMSRLLSFFQHLSYTSKY